MKSHDKNPGTPSGNPNRRKVLQALAAAPIMATFNPTDVAAAPPRKHGGNAKGAKSSKQGKGILSSKHKLLTWPSGSAATDARLKKLQKWDFEAFIYVLLAKFEEGEDDAAVQRFATTVSEQGIKTDGTDRNLSIYLTKDIEFIHAAVGGAVVGFKVVGQSVRSNGAHSCPFDSPAADCPEDHPNNKTSHLVYSPSSSSSSRWG